MNEIIHVHIIDDLSGALLADVDASSVADGMAYYVNSRHLDDLTADRIQAQANPRTVRSSITTEKRLPDGSLVWALSAHVEGSCPALAACGGAR